MVRTLIPLTHEDKEQSGNLPLIQTLRSVNPKSSASVTQGGAPPSFYEEDLKKWAKKFANSIKERNEFKRQYLSDRKTTCLNSNDNIRASFDLDQKLSTINYTGGQMLPTKSEFKRVL